MQSNTLYQKVASYEAKKGEVKSVALMYSGGLDTSVILKWLQDEYNVDVYTVTFDIGQTSDDLVAVQKKALKFGAKKAIVIDHKDAFANEVLSKAIKANAKYQNEYFISCPLGRASISKKMAEIAEELKVDAVAHGCTGKGNDQVRFEGYLLTFAPDIKIIAPVREWSMGRDEELKYAKKHGIETVQSENKIYSYDENMWGNCIEGGVTEDLEKIPPLSEMLRICNPPEKAPDTPEFIEITFEKGIPVSLNSEKISLAKIIMKLLKIGATHSIGVHHCIEDRLVGLKVREVYEQPAAEILIKAHKSLEMLVCSRDENEYKEHIDQKWAYMAYGALYYHPLMNHLNAYIDSVNEKVNGKVTVKIYKGTCEIVALESPYALYDKNLSTFYKNTAFNQNCSAGFISIYTGQMRLAHKVKEQNASK
ncbi:argininosuccinate synthase [Candidatus Peregrinibacteria bacterium]|nr:argininosuccinate synthase [Candidatus Peregrinibacteria bacterium]